MVLIHQIPKRVNANLYADWMVRILLPLGAESWIFLEGFSPKETLARRAIGFREKPSMKLKEKDQGLLNREICSLLQYEMGRYNHVTKIIYTLVTANSKMRVNLIWGKDRNHSRKSNRAPEIRVTSTQH